MHEVVVKFFLAWLLEGMHIAALRIHALHGNCFQHLVGMSSGRLFERPVLDEAVVRVSPEFEVIRDQRVHVAAQVDISNEVLSPERARDYLERYFGKTRKPSIDIYWGTAEEFAAGLAAAFRAEQ